MEDNFNKFISVSYQLHTVDNGQKELVEEVTQEQPYQFISGFGITLEKFEAAISSLKESEEFEINLTPEEAYGNFEQEHVLDLEKDIFSIDGQFDSENIYPGAVVPLQNEDGTRFMGNILEVTDNMVKVDLNHPLAGKSLHFKGKVIESREATNDEISAMFNQISGSGCGCGGGCSCGCGSEDGNCGCSSDDKSCGCGN